MRLNVLRGGRFQIVPENRAEDEWLTENWDIWYTSRWARHLVHGEVNRYQSSFDCEFNYIEIAPVLKVNPLNEDPFPCCDTHKSEWEEMHKDG